MNALRSPLAWLPLLLGAALLVSYIFLPFVTQPELGPSTFSQVNASRDSNEFDLETSGAQLFLFAAGITLLAGVWGLTNRQLNRAVSAVTALGGVLVLEYFAVFFPLIPGRRGHVPKRHGAQLLADAGARSCDGAAVRAPSSRHATRIPPQPPVSQSRERHRSGAGRAIRHYRPQQPALFSRTQPARHLAGQRLYRRRRHRHVYGHYHRQY